MMANIQPEPAVTAEWDMSNLTYNQGVHGAQDTANSLMRLGVRFQVTTDDWRSDSFAETVTNFAHAACAVNRMRKARVAIMGQMPGMGDILTGPPCLHAQARTADRPCEPRPGGQGDGRRQGRRDRRGHRKPTARNFEIDPAISDETHRYAARLQVAIKKVIDDGGYDAWSLYFDQIGDDGRFRQTHMMAASNLMAEGYGIFGRGRFVLCQPDGRRLRHRARSALHRNVRHGLRPRRGAADAIWGKATGRSPARTVRSN